MWNDANKEILDILEIISNKNSLPLKCPVCGKYEAHVYMYRWKQEKKGSIWTWCSACKVSAHERLLLPDWWKNSQTIDDNLLGVHPDMLEENKEFVDDYVNRLMNEKNPDAPL